MRNSVSGVSSTTCGIPTCVCVSVAAGAEATVRLRLSVRFADEPSEFFALASVVQSVNVNIDLSITGLTLS